MGVGEEIAKVSDNQVEKWLRLGCVAVCFQDEFACLFDCPLSLFDNLPYPLHIFTDVIAICVVPIIVVLPYFLLVDIDERLADGLVEF